MSLTRMPSEPEFGGSEEVFLGHLRMDVGLVGHRCQYRKIKIHALRGHRRICSDRSNLLPYLQNDPSIRPPFTLHQLTEKALYSEAERMYAESRDELRRIYDEGSADGDNWVIRWLLWRIFEKGGEEEEEEEEEEGEEEGDENANGPGGVAILSPAAALNLSRQGQYWDPVREAWSDAG